MTTQIDAHRQRWRPPLWGASLGARNRRADGRALSRGRDGISRSRALDRQSACTRERLTLSCDGSARPFVLGNTVACGEANSDGWYFVDHEVYTEVVIPLNGQLWPLYAIRVSDDFMAAVACWDHRFDEPIDELSKNASIIEKPWRQTYPTFMNAIDSAAKESVTATVRCSRFSTLTTLVESGSLPC
jgi:hypothetical protein